MSTGRYRWVEESLTEKLSQDKWFSGNAALITANTAVSHLMGLFTQCIGSKEYEIHSQKQIKVTLSSIYLLICYEGKETRAFTYFR